MLQAQSFRTELNKQMFVTTKHAYIMTGPQGSSY